MTSNFRLSIQYYCVFSLSGSCLCLIHESLRPELYGILLMLRTLRSIPYLLLHHDPYFLTHYTDSLSSIHILSSPPTNPNPKTINSKHADLFLEIFYLFSELNVLISLVRVKSHYYDNLHNSDLSW